MHKINMGNYGKQRKRKKLKISIAKRDNMGYI